MSIKRYHITVIGRVQGVGYRYFTRDAAQNLGLSGWVRNTNDGRVELEIEGEQADIDKLIEKLREGPALSRVVDVEVQIMAAMNKGGEFFIKR
ncbi:MAG: acylphosphatase [Chitinispirillales bacterium]|jgi:acylphosphatase|nr:acylphosphatase [Chitinispirillales bacterium]